MSEVGPKPQFNGFHFSSHCPKIEGAGISCMCCFSAEATGHGQIDGGVNDGRVIMLLCPRCSSEEGYRDFVDALMHQQEAGVINLITGGPGQNGAPDYWHRDHWDPLVHEH